MTIINFLKIVSFTFFVFILWIIYLANTGQSSVFFKFVASIPYGDKVGHFCIFGVLTLAANFLLKCKTLTFTFVSNKELNLYVGSMLVFLFALTEELSQFFIANRTLDIFDLLADILGIVIFSFLTACLHRYSNER
ncbi:MAG: VanZ family protein [Colwellia sp.]